MPLFKRAPLFHLPQEMEPPKSDKTFLTTSSQFGEHSGQVELRLYPPLHSALQWSDSNAQCSAFSFRSSSPLKCSLFRDPLNGAWCDSLHFADDDDELTPCGEGNNFYSSAGMHLVSELVYIFSFDLCFDAL